MASHDSHDSHEHDDYMPHVHVSSIAQNTGVFVALVFLTIITIAAYSVRLGEANLFVAIFIASIKATLVCAFFMHLLYENPFNTLFFLGTFAFVIVFVGYTVNDAGYRGQFQSDVGRRIDQGTGNYAYGTAADFQETGGFELLDTDYDGVPDLNDRCPETPRPTAELVIQVDEFGCEATPESK